ncbi:MAG TPA: class I SAM-dependent methyltransferase [Chloroflexota bacterium]|nr:class I SAM-dependent methyltransferase [Chloroflexota bacterium]
MNPDAAFDSLLGEQIAYYRARAGEYDEWFLRRGRYDRGAALNQQWFDEVGEVARALDTFAPTGRILELAGGTGLWTERLARYSDDLTVVDASPEVLAINRARVCRPAVRYVEADLFSWQPDAQYDVVFFGFWLSHVPPVSFDPFWGLVRSCLAPNGRVFFVDSAYNEASTAVDHRLDGPAALTANRRLNDRREFRIVKLFYRPDQLTAKLTDLGWSVTVQSTATNFLYGFGRSGG